MHHVLVWPLLDVGYVYMVRYILQPVQSPNRTSHANKRCAVVMVQVVVLSEGNQVYMGRPDKAVEWFSLKLGYSYQPVRDGAVSDWLMDLVSVGFQKPPSYAARYACLSPI
jgi:hypothetical protein